jgi:aminoglycoside 2'-N-acetyltransferase I
VVQRRLFYQGRTLRAGYVEAVAVRADRRGYGYGALVMDALERVIRAAYEVGALGAGETAAGFYRRRGWRPWEGRTWAVAPSGLVRTPEKDQGVYVLEVSVALDVSKDLACDWREGDLW